MNGLTDFMSNMTIWNWLALIAFIFFPLSAVNAFFGLRSRFLDWRGGKSKEKFPHRLDELDLQISSVLEYRLNPRTFWEKILQDALSAFLFFIISLFLFIWAFLIFVSPFGSTLTEFPFILGALILLSASLRLTLRLRRLSRTVADADDLRYHARDFIQKGRDNGLVSERGKKQIEDIEQKIEKLSGRPENTREIDESEREFLRAHQREFWEFREKKLEEEYSWLRRRSES